jgi:hypothetical protein
MIKGQQLSNRNFGFDIRKTTPEEKVASNQIKLG